MSGRGRLMSEKATSPRIMSLKRKESVLLKSSQLVPKKAESVVNATRVSFEKFDPKKIIVVDTLNGMIFDPYSDPPTAAETPMTSAIPAVSRLQRCQWKFCIGFK